MIHPQSIVHSVVEFVDGSVIAQLSPPDMRLPIQYALTWPERREGPAKRLDWSWAWHLDFEPPDQRQSEALRLGLEVARVGGTAGAVLNAANEAAVAAFLAGKLKFTQIVPAARAALNNHQFDSDPTLERLFELDRWATRGGNTLGLYLIASVLDLGFWWIVLQVAIGLGLVIFVHELGHFAVAKLCGVKCEKFYLGFDIGGWKNLQGPVG